MKRLQQLLHHIDPKFRSFKGFFIANACEKYFFKITNYFQRND